MTMDAIIKWNTEHNGVEIQTNDEHFVIDAQPSKVLTWHDAVRFYQNAGGWALPTKKQLQLVGEHINEINTLIKQHDGYELFGWHWSSDEYNDICAWGAYMSNGNTDLGNKGSDYYVRAVSVIQNKAMNYNRKKLKAIKDFLMKLPDAVLLPLYNNSAADNYYEKIFENTEEILNGICSSPYDALASAFYGKYSFMDTYVKINNNGYLESSKSLGSFIDFGALAEWVISNNPCEIRNDLEDTLMDIFIEPCLSTYKNAEDTEAFLYCNLIEDDWDSVMLNIKNEIAGNLDKDNE